MFLVPNHFLIVFLAPPLNQRTWKAPPRVDRLDGGIPGRTLSDKHIVAEVRCHDYYIILYIHQCLL